MKARVLSSSSDGINVTANVQFLDDTDPANPVELESHVFLWGSTAIGQQVKADIVAYGKALADRKADTDRILAALQPGNEITI